MFIEYFIAHIAPDLAVSKCRQERKSDTKNPNNYIRKTIKTLAFILLYRKTFFSPINVQNYMLSENNAILWCIHLTKFFHLCKNKKFKTFISNLVQTL